MHVHRTNPYTLLLRHSYRDGSRVRKCVLANLNDWSAEALQKLRFALRYKRAVRGTLEEADANKLIKLLLMEHAAATPHVAYLAGALLDRRSNRASRAAVSRKQLG